MDFVSVFAQRQVQKPSFSAHLSLHEFSGAALSLGTWLDVAVAAAATQARGRSPTEAKRKPFAVEVI